MSTTTIEVPQLGNTVEECLVTRWLKRKGDVVVAGDVVAEIETDKTTFEITAPVDGTVLDTFVDEGAIVPVFTKLFVIGDAAELVASAPVLTPRARKFAAAHDFDPGAIAGSGPGGRVLERDVQRAYENSQADLPTGTPLSATRQTIARRMRESLASTAQYTLHASADARALVALRARYKQSLQTADITINDLVAYCSIRALLQSPEINAHLVGGRIVSHSEVHLAFACDTARGLMAPVVRSANTLTLPALAARMRELTDQAIAGTIAVSDLSGATFTISNLGALGIESFTPVLNPPQVAILGVGAIHVKAIRTDDRIDFIDAIGLSLTCDHQVIDGAPGARFLQVLVREIQSVGD